MPADEIDVGAMIRAKDLACPFGPSFFLRDLRTFVRQRCPDAAEALPVVQLHLGRGEVLDLCHIVGISPAWVALAVWDDAVRGQRGMRTELVPFEAIVRVTVRSHAPAGQPIGFDLDQPMPETVPQVLRLERD